MRVSGGHLCEEEAPTEPAGETAVKRAAIHPLSLRSRVNGCGNPFFPFSVLRILSCFALRMTYRLVTVVRVSGGDLCEAEAPTEPAGETAVKRAAIRPLSLRSRVNGCGNPFFFSITDFFARSARNKKRGGYIAVSFLLYIKTANIA